MSKIITHKIEKSNGKRIFFSHLTYGKRLRLARHHKQWTQTELSQYSGVKQNSISKIENDKYRASSFDVDLAYALDIDQMWLRTGREEFEPKWMRIQVKKIN